MISGQARGTARTPFSRLGLNPESPTSTLGVPGPAVRETPRPGRTRRGVEEFGTSVGS